MADQTVTLRIKTDAKGTIAEIAKVDASVDRLGESGKAGGRKVAAGMDRASRETKAFGTTTKRTAAVANRSHKRMAQGVNSISTQLDRLQKYAGWAAAIVAGGQSIRVLSQMADQYTNLQSKVKLVTDSQREAIRVQQQLFEVAQRTRSSLESTGNLYVKLARNTDQLELSQQQLLQITETTNKSFVISGASAGEAAAAIQQLAQGLASGTLRGEEFNSIAEQAPIIMDLIAKETGIAKGQLRAYAAQGKLSAEVVAKALLHGADEIDAQYKRIQLTIGGAWTQLTNAVSNYVGQAASASGASATLAESIAMIARHIPEIMGVAVALGKVALMAASLMAVGKAMVFIRGASGAARVALLLFTKRGRVALRRLRGQALGASAAIKSIQGAIGVAAAAVGGWQLGKTIRKKFWRARLYASYFVESVLKWWEYIKEGAKVVWTAIVHWAIKGVNQIRKLLGGFVSDAAQALAYIPGIADATIAKLNAMAAGLKTPVGPAKSLADAISDIHAEAEKARGQIEKITGDQQSYIVATRNSAKATKELDESLDGSGNGNGQGGLAGGASAASDAMAKFNDMLELAQLRMSGLTKDQAAYVMQIRDLGDLYDQMVAAGMDAADAQTILNTRVQDAVAVREQQQDALAAAEKGLESYGDTSEDVAQQSGKMAQIVGRSAQSMADAFAGWMTGTLSQGHSFADQMVDLIKRMVAQMIAAWAKVKIFGPMLRSIFGSMGGSMGGSTGGFGGNMMSSFFGGGGSGGGNWLTSIFSAGKAAFGGEGSIFSGNSWLGFGKNLWNGFSEGFGGWADSLGSLFGLGGSAGLAYGGTSALIGAGGFAGYGGVSVAAYNAAPLAANYGALSAYGGYGAGTAAVGGTGAAGSGVAGGLSATGIGAIIAAAIMWNMHLLGSGWDPNAKINRGADNWRANWDIGGWLNLKIGEWLTPILGEGLASALTGSALNMKMFGHQRPTIQQQGINARFSMDEVTAEAWAQWKAEGGWFRSDDWGEITDTVSDDVMDSLKELWAMITDAMTSAAQSLGANMDDILSGFSIGLRTRTKTVDGEEVTRYLVDYLGRTWEEATQEAAAQRVGAEGIIAVIDGWLSEGAKEVEAKVKSGGGPKFPDLSEGLKPDDIRRRFARIPKGPVPGSPEDAAATMGEASQIAERWREDAEKLAEGARFLLAAATHMSQGLSLIGETGPGSLTKITDLVEDLAQADEKLLQTYTRLRKETQLYRDAMALAGVTLDATGEAIVRFADDLTAALGGLQNAAKIIGTFNKMYFDQTELANMQIEKMRAQKARLLEGIGLDATTTMAEFKKAYLAAAGSLSAEQLAKWYRAGVSLGQLTQMIEQLAAAEANAALKLTMAKAKYEQFIGGIDKEIAGYSGSWAESFHSLTGQLEGLIQKANALAKAAGMQGAAEQDLAKIHEYIAKKAAAMIAALEQQSRGLASQLYGDGMAAMSLSQLNARIAELQGASQSAANGIQTAARQINDTAQLLISDLSPYRDRKKLRIAKQMYLRGDASKQDVLQIARDLFASTSQYKKVFEWVLDNQQRQRTQTGGPVSTGGNTGGSANLAKLIKRRDELMAQQRRQMATQLAANLAQYAKVSEDSFSEIAKEWGFSLSELAADLGTDNVKEYLKSIQKNDIPGALGSVANTITEAIRQLGADLIAAWGVDVAAGGMHVARTPITDPDGTTNEPGGMHAAVSHTVVNSGTSSADTTNMLERLRALEVAINAVGGKIDETGKLQGRWFPRIAENTEATSEGVGEVAENTRDMAADGPPLARSARPRDLQEVR